MPPSNMDSPRVISISETNATPSRLANSSRALTPRFSAAANKCSMQPEPLRTDVSGRCVCASRTRGGDGASRSRPIVWISGPVVDQQAVAGTGRRQEASRGTKLGGATSALWKLGRASVAV